ncbi:MAG: PHP domain-containing protein [Armatimonadetes bacterium]|nr:PHP domain-containing protein [Armatimonadota bacterium]
MRDHTLDGSLPYDGHVHTTASDGRNSAAECVRAAEAVGLRAIAITDHLFASGTRDLEEYVKVLARLDASSSVTVIPGVEATILNPRGDVSISVWEARLLRWVLVDFGSYSDGIARNPPVTREALLKNIEQAMCGAAANPAVDAIAHPFNFGRFAVRLDPSELPKDMLARIANAMAEHNCAFELMNQAYWWYPELSVDEFVNQFAPVIALFADAGVNFVVGSDAHSVCGVGNLQFSRRLMRAAGVENDMLVDLEALNDRRRWEQAHGRRLV